MADIDVTPQVLNIAAYGGDTLSIQVSFPAGYVAGRIWKAQIRSKIDASVVDANFTVTLGANQDAPIHLVLPSTVTRQLVTAASLLRAPQAVRRSAMPLAVGDPLTSYEGVWDCQLAPSAGGDPTTTVARGTIKISLDVTRTP